LLLARSTLAADLPAQPACAVPPVETALMSEQGSAGVMYNLAEHPTSIRAVAKKLLSAAVVSATAAQGTPCVGACGSGAAPTILFKVTPSAYMPMAQQQALCHQMVRQTQARPLHYGPRTFPNVAAFDAWLMEFSQGRGRDGRLLYQQCGGDCDPSFTFSVKPEAQSLVVDAAVVCGYARDRDINNYQLSTALLAGCSAPPAIGAE
jgi:hypothetical protein